MTNPIDVIADAIRTADGNHTLGAGQLAEVAANALTDGAIVVNAVQALRRSDWTRGDVEEISDRDLHAIARTVLHSVGGAA